MIRLPAPTTPLVGRQQEVAEVIDLLHDPASQLVTLLGPGGIGKTRLALGIAHQVLRENSSWYPDGIYYAALAATQTAEGLINSLAVALGMTFYGRPGEDRVPEYQKLQLLDYLRDKKLLLVIDNFEQLVNEASLLGEIIDAAPSVTLLVTTRERLNLAQEWIYELDGMTYPLTNQPGHSEQYSAIELFIQAARRSRADYSMSQDDFGCVADICRTLKGVPLAIEMAAAWTRMFSCSEIIQRISSNLDFLTSPWRGTPDRHKSLRGVFEYSWISLTPPEQTALAALSVFRGAFRLEVAESVITSALDFRRQSEPEEFRFTPEPLLLVSSLVDKSLLRRVTARTRGLRAVDRFEIHDLMRQFAQEKQQSDVLAAQVVSDQFSEYYIRLLEKLSEDIRSEDQLDALELIDSDLEAFRTAWENTFSGLYKRVNRRAAEALFQYYNLRSLYQEGETDFSIAVAGIERWLNEECIPAEDLMHIRGLNALSLMGEGFFCSGRGETRRASELYEKCLEITPGLTEFDRAIIFMYLEFDYTRPSARIAAEKFEESMAVLRASGDRWAQAALLLGHALYSQNVLPDLGRAVGLLRESLELFRVLGDRWGMEVCYNSLALQMYGLGEYEQVKLLTLEGLALSQALSDRWQVAEGLLNLGQADTALGNYERAKEDYQTSLAIMRELGNRRSIATHLACLGYVQYLLAEYPDAESSFKEALWLTEEVNDQREIGMEYINLGNIARAQQKPEEARQRYLHALAIMESIGEYWGKSVALKRLGSLSFSLGEVSQAWEYFRQALQISLDIDRKPEIIELLVSIAEILILEGEFKRALEILNLCLAQREMTEDVHQFAVRLLEQVNSEITSQSILAQIPQLSMTIRNVAQNVLDEHC